MLWADWITYRGGLAMGSMFLKVMVGVWLLLAFSPDASSRWLNREDLFRTIKYTTDLGDEEINRILDLLGEELELEPGQEMRISAAMYADGWSLGFFHDTDKWLLDLTFIDSQTDTLVTLPEFYSVEFNNGGLKAEWALTKRLYIFIPEGMTIEALDGAVFGRGFGVGLLPLLGGELGTLPGRNRPGRIYYAAWSAGVGVGVTFPRMSFEKADIARPRQGR